MKTFVQILLFILLAAACTTYKTLTEVTTQREQGKSIQQVRGKSQILYSGCCGCVGKVYTREVGKTKELEFFSDCNCSGNALTAEVTVRKVLVDGTIKRFIFAYKDTLVENKSDYSIHDFFEQRELDLITSDSTERACDKIKLLTLDKFFLQRILTIKKIDMRYSNICDSAFSTSIFDISKDYKRRTNWTDTWRWSK